MDRLCQRMRSLVHDCLAKHLYDSAIFYADKLMTMSNGAAADVYTLAEVIQRHLPHRILPQYCRFAAEQGRDEDMPEQVMIQYDLFVSNIAQAFYMGKQWRRALALLRNAGLIEADVRCRYLAARCLAEVQDWEECLNVLGGWDESELEALSMQVCTHAHSFIGPCLLKPTCACLYW